jgi:hypothetical protein
MLKKRFFYRRMTEKILLNGFEFKMSHFIFDRTFSQ